MSKVDSSDGKVLRMIVGPSMHIPTDFTSCSGCGQPIDEPPNTLVEARVQCPTCGSTTRTFNSFISESVILREKIGLRLKRPGHKKAIFESVSGADLHRKTGRWNELIREIDRQNDRYREHIVNSETGEVIRSVDEPLTEHRGRGSAKHCQKA